MSDGSPPVFIVSGICAVPDVKAPAYLTATALVEAYFVNVKVPDVLEGKQPAK